MRQFRKLIAIAVAAASVLGACADVVSSDLALAAANAWVAANPSFGARGAAVSAEAEYDGTTLMWWVVRLDGGGAVFVAPETSIDPVLAAVPQYAGVLPAAHPLRAILSADVANRRRVIAEATVVTSRPRGSNGVNGVITNAAVAEAVSAAANRWTKLTTARPRARDVVVLAPTTNIVVVSGFGDEADNVYMRFWDQSRFHSMFYKYYDHSVPGAIYDPESGYWVEPVDSGLRSLNLSAEGEQCFNLYTPDNAVCGCVATAGAAILQHFKCSGLVKNVMRECSYNGPTVNLTTISATNRYDWSMLPKDLGGDDPRELSAFSDEEVEAVLSLLGRATYDMGVCVNMAYTSGESGADTLDIATALVNDFGFHHAKAVTFSGTNGLEVAEAITNDICRFKRPVALGIRGSGGHAVLGVGYGEDDEGMQYTRLFMGWGGEGDAWYNLPEIKAGAHVFNLVQKAVTSIALKPPMGLGHQTIAEAKTAALESNKPILLISGTEGEELTDDLINYILSSANDYTNKFEIYFADYATSPHADQNPSYGVFSPLSFNKDDEENRWAFFNGRLSYFTNEIAVAAIPAEVDAVLNAGLEKWEEEYAQHLHDEAAQADGISLVVYQGSYYLGEAVGAYLPDEMELEDCYDNVYTNGETVVLSAPCAFATNQTDEVAWKCVGWALYDTKKEDPVASDDGTNATFAVSAGTAYEFYWIWEPDAVKATITVPKGGGSVTPDASGGVWLEYGTTNAFVAVPANDGISQFDSWKGDAYRYEVGSAAYILAISPCNLRAYFRQNANAQSYTLTISNECYEASSATPIEPPPAPTFTPMFGDRSLENGDNTLLEGPMAVSVPEKWTDSTGGVWQCVGWVGTNSVPESGTMNTAGFDLKTNSTIIWQWEPTTPDTPTPTPPDPPIGPVEGGVTNSALVIYATNGTQLAVQTCVSNAKAGFWYSIWSADAVDGQYAYVAAPYDGTAKLKVVEPAPELLVLTIVFDPVAAAKFYRVVVTEEDPEN